MKVDQSPGNMMASQQGLHNWAMWRMSVNHDMIRGLHVTSKQSPQQPHWRHHTSDQRYIDKTPQGSQDVPQEVRNKYGKPPSRNIPMGNTTYFLYGLPRVSVNGVVPNVVSSHYQSNPNLTSNDSNDNTRIGERRRVEESSTSKQRSPSKRILQKLPRVTGTDTNSAAIDPVKYLDEIIEAHGDGDRASPINFRDRPETEYQPLYESKIPRGHEQDNKVLNKPVVVPPSVFRTEVLRRSFNAGDNIPSDGVDHFPNDVDYDDDDGFEDPRYKKFTSQQSTYVWEDAPDYQTDIRAPYVDESRMKTHV